MRAIVLALWLALAQSGGVLHIRITITEAGETTPVPGHALLISDNPATSAPRLIRTKVDGTADVNLRPGNYTIESDAPVSFHGKAYQWTQTIDVRAGRDTTLALTAANAEISAAATAPPSAGSRPLEADPAFLLPRWQDSVVMLWTPTARASAFVIDSRGLIETTQKPLGSATTAEIQLTPTTKVAARVLAADAAKDVAILWVDPKSIASLKPIPTGCTSLPAPPAQEVFAIGVPLRQPKDLTAGTMSKLVLLEGTSGGPVFTAEGTLVGVASEKVVPQRDVCDVIASAEAKMAGAMPPGGALLPIEPDQSVPEETLKAAASKRVGSLNPYQVSTSGFEVSFITPVMIPGSHNARLFDFGTWSWYVEALPQVLFVRVTPKMIEGFWTKVARGAAYTQGAAIPSIKHAGASFARLRAYCGDREVTPIHPFVLDTRISEKESLGEGLYVFDPAALGPQCASVKLELFSEKAPEKAETRVVEPAIVQRISEDFSNVR